MAETGTIEEVVRVDGGFLGGFALRELRTRQELGRQAAAYIVDELGGETTDPWTYAAAMIPLELPNRWVIPEREEEPQLVRWASELQAATSGMPIGLIRQGKLAVVHNLLPHESNGELYKFTVKNDSGDFDRRSGKLVLQFADLPSHHPDQEPRWDSADGSRYHATKDEDIVIGFDALLARAETPEERQLVADFLKQAP